MISTQQTIEKQTLENLTLNITQEIQVRASLDVTFESLLEQLGPANETPEGPMPMKIEPWPGGRWFRDLGDGNGHFWGQVQAIKRPTLLEITGPLFMSYPVVFELAVPAGRKAWVTVITFHHTALGLIQDEHRTGVVKGWTHMHDCLRVRADAPASR